MKSFYNFFVNIYHYRNMIWTMAKRDLKNRYVGSYIGLLWSVIHPLAMIFIYWFIFSIGFKVAPEGGVPFVTWFFAALCLWNTFSETVISSSNSVLENSNLVTKTSFPSEILPFVKLISALINHLIMLMILVVLLLLSKIKPSIFWLQIPIYLGAMSILALGLSFFFASLNVFIRDMGQILGVFMQIWFWGTPIIWQTKMIPEKYLYLIRLNPLYFLVEGYRGSLFYGTGIFNNYSYLIYFLLISTLLFFLGTFTFKKLKRGFADVL